MSYIFFFSSRRRHTRCLSDWSSDVCSSDLKMLGIKYLPANCASSYRAIHESLINYGGNKMPEFLTCMHEESAVGMRSEERRVGKECRSRWSPYRQKKSKAMLE